MPLYTYARPSSDDRIDFDWQRVPAGGSLASAIDDVSVDQTDIISCSSSPFSGDPQIVYRCGLTAQTDPGVDTDHSLRVWMQAAAGTHGARIRFLAGAGPTLIATADRTVTPGHVLHQLDLTAGEAAAISNYGQLYAEVILLPDGSNWTLEVAMLEFRLPSTFAHLDASGSALVNAAAGSGNYLEASGGGLIRRAGTEGAGALILPTGAGLKVQS